MAVLSWVILADNERKQRNGGALLLPGVGSGGGDRRRNVVAAGRREFGSGSGAVGQIRLQQSVPLGSAQATATSTVDTADHHGGDTLRRSVGSKLVHLQTFSNSFTGTR